MFNYILHFCSSSLCYIQFSHVRFRVMTPCLCLIFQLWHSQGFLQPQYCIGLLVYLSFVTIVLLIVSKVELAYFTAPALCLEHGGRLRRDWRENFRWGDGPCIRPSNILRSRGVHPTLRS